MTSRTALIVKEFFSKGHERTLKAKKNIVLSFIFKSINIAIQFLLVPLLLNYLSPVKYGIWVTIGSVINWFYFFDIGLGNGLRNKLAEALARNEEELARIYISTTYAALSIIVIILYLIFLIVDKFINWQFIFNAPSGLKSELNVLIIFVFTFFAINFIVRLIGSILNADQKPATNDLIHTGGNLIALILVFVLSKVIPSSLVLVGIIFSASTFIPAFVVSIWFFSKEYKRIRPSYEFVKFVKINDLASLGIKFFILQIAAVVVFTTDNFIIIQLFGPAQVTPYSIAFKYFSIVLMGLSIIATPFWSAFTEAYTKNDFEWIKTKIRQLVKIWFIIICVVLGMIIFAQPIYTIWIGEEINIPFSLTILMGVFIILNTWSIIFAYFINGVGKIKLSFIISIINTLLNIPLSIFFAKTIGLGIQGVILGTCISISLDVIIRPIQYRKIINRTAAGIWNK